MQFIHQTSKTSIKALFWVFLEGATVFRGHTNSAPMPYTNILRLSVFLSLVLVQVVLSRCSEELNRSLHAYKDKQWHQLRCQSAKCSFLLPRLQWALSLWSVSNFVSRASLLPSFVFFFACPSSSRSCISSLISNEQVYSFNFPTNMPRFQVCTTSGGAGTRGLGSRVTLINSRPLPGMTNFPGAVTKKYDAPFVSPSGSCDRLANHRAAGLNLPNFSTKQKALQSRKQTQPCCLTGRDYTEVLSAYNYK